MAHKVKFRDMPLGGRFDDYGRAFIVIQRHGDGLVASECLRSDNVMLHQSICCFVDVEAGITLDTEVNFIGLDNPADK